MRPLVIEGALDDAMFRRLRKMMGRCPYNAVVVLDQRPPMVAEIIDRVAYEMGVKHVAIVGDRRFKPLTRARAAVSWIARETSPVSLPQIGRAMGGRDHSTIIGQLRHAEALRASDPAFRRLTDRLAAEFSGEQA